MINSAKKTTWLTICIIVFLLAAGFFVYQWWQVKGELARQIERNESLKNQVAELQAEIDKLKKEIEELKVFKGKAIEETISWKTYKNEEYGFEIDYPIVGWKFDGESLCRLLEVKKRESENKQRFCIDISIEFLSSSCYDYSWKEIFSKEDIIEGGCTGRIYGGVFKEEIITSFGNKGYKGKMTVPYGEECYTNNEMIVYFTLKKEVKLKDKNFLPLVAIHYLDCQKYFNFSQKEVEVFDRVVSSFRYIEK